MLASLADAPLDDPQLVYEPKYDGIRAIVEVGAAHPCVCGRASATRRPGSSPPSSPRSRSGRAGSKRPVVLDGEIVALDDKGEPAGFQKLQGGARHRVHRLRHPARRQDATCAIARCSSAAPSSSASSGGRGRRSCASASSFAATAARCTARARAGLGRADRQARRLALQVRQADAGLAQAEDRPRTGIRDRRLDRAAPDARLLRRAAARRLRGTRSRLHGPHRHRLQREGARARDEAAQAARDEDVPVQDEAEDERAAALGAAGARRADQVHRVDRRRQAAPSGVSRAARRQEAGRRYA